MTQSQWCKHAIFVLFTSFVQVEKIQLQQKKLCTFQGFAGCYVVRARWGRGAQLLLSCWESASSGGDSWAIALPSGGINTCIHIRFCSYLELLFGGRELRVHLSVAASHGLAYCPVFMNCNADGSWSVLYFIYVQRGQWKKKFLVSVDFRQWLNRLQTINCI